MTKWVDDASNAPNVLFGNSEDLACSCSKSLLEHSIRLVYGQNHSDRSTVQGRGAGVDVLLQPEVCSLDGQLSHDNLSTVILQAIPLDCAKRCLVIVHSLCSLADREPWGEAGLDWFVLGGADFCHDFFLLIFSSFLRRERRVGPAFCRCLPMTYTWECQMLIALVV